MKKVRHIALLSLCAMLLSAPDVSAKRAVYSYTQRNYFVSQGVSVSANALYYFGDVDNDFWRLGGSLAFAYTMPVSRHCNLRYSLMGGALQADNEANFRRRRREDFRRFNSILLQPSFGVEIYPFPQAGFVLYAGVSVTGSFITNYTFRYKQGGAMDEVSGSTYGILPMVQVGLGYHWRLSDSWTLGVELMLQEGLVDRHYMNLDAYPLAASQNSKGVELGSPGFWNDGWYQLGLTVSYRWKTCGRCRILNNYNVTY